MSQPPSPTVAPPAPEARAVPAAAAAPSSRGGVTLRAVAIGALLIPVTIYWITVTEVRWYTLDGTSLPLFIQPIFFLFCLCMANLLVKKVRRRPWLEQGEL